MALVLEVPDDVARAMRLPAAERKQRAELELACALYAQGVLPCGKAAQLAGMSRFRFGEELSKRNIARHYTPENLRQDLEDDGCGGSQKQMRRLGRRSDSRASRFAEIIRR